MYWVIHSSFMLWSRAAEVKQEVNFLLPINQGMIPFSTHLVSITFVLSHLCSSFPSLSSICKLLPPTFPPGDFKGVESKTKTPTHPHVLQCLRLEVYHAEVRVQHLIPSELPQVFVHSKGLEVCIWAVFIISRCTQQQETTFWLYEVPTGVAHNDVSHAK